MTFNKEQLLHFFSSTTSEKSGSSIKNLTKELWKELNFLNNLFL